MERREDDDDDEVGMKWGWNEVEVKINWTTDIDNIRASMMKSSPLDSKAAHAISRYYLEEEMITW